MKFLDIETTAQYRTWDLVPEEQQALFSKRFEREFNSWPVSSTWNDFYLNKAPFCAEFGKIICICMGIIVGEDTLRIKTWCASDEPALLNAFNTTLAASKSHHICAHNGKEFDFPFLFRRMLINSIEPHSCLDVYEVKPWEQTLHDSMSAWSSTAYNYKVSLDLLCYSLGIKSPKAEISGADVGPLWFSIDNVIRETEVCGIISKYCQGDVVALAKVWHRLMFMQPINKIEIV